MSDFDCRVARRPVVLFLLLPVRPLHGRRVLLHVHVPVVAAAVRRLTRRRRRRLLLVLPALAPQHIVEAGDEEDAADNAAPIQDTEMSQMSRWR